MARRSLPDFIPSFTLAVNPDRHAVTKQKNRLLNYLFVFSAAFLLFFASACQGSKTERAVANQAQPVLDSTYYINYIKSEPKFKDQLDWVKSFYREREFQLGWFKNNKIVPEADKMLGIISKAGE